MLYRYATILNALLRTPAKILRPGVGYRQSKSLLKLVNPKSCRWWYPTGTRCGGSVDHIVLKRLNNDRSPHMIASP